VLLLSYFLRSTAGDYFYLTDAACSFPLEAWSTKGLAFTTFYDILCIGSSACYLANGLEKRDFFGDGTPALGYSFYLGI